MQELGRHVHDETQILFGAAVDGRLGDRLTVTIISSLAAEQEVISQPRDRGISNSAFMPPPREQQQETLPTTNGQPEPTGTDVAPPEQNISFNEPVTVETEPVAIPVQRELEPVVAAPQHEAFPASQERPPAEKSVQAKQEVLQFEPVTRGRFEKSEPTIIEGEDLDVPTYLRKNVKVK
jgi:cell division protein FtsZ